MAKLVQLKDRDGNVYPQVYGLAYTEIVTLASNLSVNANTNTNTATYTLSPRIGYTPIFVATHNLWNGTINLWYCNISSSANTIAWRVRNVSNSNATGLTIQVKVLYIKTRAFLT